MWSTDKESAKCLLDLPTDEFVDRVNQALVTILASSWKDALPCLFLLVIEHITRCIQYLMTEMFILGTKERFFEQLFMFIDVCYCYHILLGWVVE